MKGVYLHKIIKIIDGKVVCGKGNPLITHVAKRTIKNQNTLLFHFDRGNLFLEESNMKKTIAVVTDNPQFIKNIDNNVIVVEVKNIKEAYWKFVSYYRSLFDIPIIGITGTSGKTTTKEMVKYILEKDHEVQATIKSNNASFKNLAYLTGIEDKTDIAVIEMGVDYPGDLRESCQYFRPQIRVILNIGVHHLRGCKTPERYRKAKEEILEDFDLNKDILILNADDENIKKIDVTKFKNRMIYFGYKERADFQAKNVKYSNGGMTFTLIHQNKEIDTYVPGYGEHNVYNALAAIAIVSQLGMNMKEACYRLASFQQVTQHLEIVRGINGTTIIDDTWNSSSTSMSAALDVLKNLGTTKTKIAILGYMPQLGDSDFANQQYRKMGEKVLENGIDLLIVIGEEAKEIGRRAIEKGMQPSNVMFYHTGEQVYDSLENKINSQTIILLKITHRVMVEPSFVELLDRIVLKENN